VGSGLILLVIVAAWLAVLVPMALRSHESSTSLASVDRFSDAMRVLSRRDVAARARARREAEDDPLSAAHYASGVDDDELLEWDDDELGPPLWRERLSGIAQRLRAGSPAVRRRRLLITLVLLTVGCFVGGALGPPVLLAVGAASLGACVLFVLQLRRLAVARAARRRPAPTRRPAAAPAPLRSGSVRVQTATVPIEDDVAPVTHVEPLAPAVRYDDAPPAAVQEQVYDGQAHQEQVHDEPVHEEQVYEPVWAPPAAAIGAPWSPVPLPPPTYVTKAVAPRRAQRTVDLTRPGAWTEQESARAAEELPGTGAPAAPAADRRRAVNDW
jgi:hypothetical protein